MGAPSPIPLAAGSFSPSSALGVLAGQFQEFASKITYDGFCAIAATSLPRSNGLSQVIEHAIISNDACNLVSEP
jgi:hypothetical protein